MPLEGNEGQETQTVKIKVGINRMLPGRKLPPGDPLWGQYTRSFFTQEITPEQFLNLTAVRHFAFCPEMKDGYRIKTNFISAQHIVLDFDTEDERSSISSLLCNPLIAQYAHHIYTTPSHTPEKPRARVVFILDEPITDLAQYERIAKGVTSQFPDADQTVAEASRFLYGMGINGQWVKVKA